MDTLQVAKPMPVIFFITFLKIPPILRLLEIHNSIFTTFYLQMYLSTFANVPRFFFLLIKNVPVFRFFKQASLLLSIKYQKR